MSVRVACVASLFFVRGWWILLVGIAAIVLPYFAVLVANQASSGVGNRPEAPTPLELMRSGSDGEGTSGEAVAAESQLLIVDAPADRQSSSQNHPETHRPETESEDDR